MPLRLLVVGYGLAGTTPNISWMESPLTLKCHLEFAEVLARLHIVKTIPVQQRLQRLIQPRRGLDAGALSAQVGFESNYLLLSRQERPMYTVKSMVAVVARVSDTVEWRISSEAIPARSCLLTAGRGFWLVAHRSGHSGACCSIMPRHVNKQRRHSAHCQGCSHGKRGFGHS